MLRGWIQFLCKYMMLPGVLVAAVVCLVLCRDDIFAQPGGAAAPVKAEPAEEY